MQQEHVNSMLTGCRFEEKDRELLTRLCGEAEARIKPQMWYDTQPTVQERDMPPSDTQPTVQEGDMLPSDTQPTGQQERIAVIVTLGGEFDALQQQYLERECLTESYMLECIGMKLLQIAYGQAAEIIYAATGKWLSDFCFLGESYPLEWMKEIFERLKPDSVTYNEAYVLQPKKSVVFFGGLAAERKKSGCHICDRCSNLRCAMRESGHENLNYGFGRIFGAHKTV